MPPFHSFPSPVASPQVPPPLAVIVTGSHALAELFDRPLAYRLRGKLVRALTDDEAIDADHRVLVCSDIWYMNQAGLRSLPTVSIGSPNVNALAAYYAPRLSSVLTVDGVFMVQLDSSGPAPLASCWGIDPASTAAAVESFEKRLLEGFVAAVPA
jgi:hypothetical protein